jgi:hypothetical protein
MGLCGSRLDEFHGKRPEIYRPGSGSREREKAMLLCRGVPKEEIKKLKVGDFFIDGEIVRLKKGHYMISFLTTTGNFFTAHEKLKTYNVFKKREGEQTKSAKKKAARKARRDSAREPVSASTEHT